MTQSRDTKGRFVRQEPAPTCAENAQVEIVDDEHCQAPKLDDYKEEQEAIGAAVCKRRWPYWAKQLFQIASLFVVAIAVAMAAYYLVLTPRMSLITTHPADMSQKPRISITPPALAVDPQIILERPEMPAQTLIVVEPSRVTGWRDGEPIAWEKR